MTARERADLIAGTLNPTLAVPELTPIEDRDPAMTARAAALVQSVRAGTLAPAAFAYLRAGFFPDGPARYAKLLTEAGATTQLVLLDRRELGDDRVSTTSSECLPVCASPWPSRQTARWRSSTCARPDATTAKWQDHSSRDASDPPRHRRVEQGRIP